MTPDEAVVAVLAALDAAAIPYMIVGSLASNFHGIPRATRDADFVVRLSHDDLDRLEQHLAPGLRLDRQGAFEGVTGTLRHLVSLFLSLSREGAWHAVLSLSRFFCRAALHH